MLPWECGKRLDEVLPREGGGAVMEGRRRCKHSGVLFPREGSDAMSPHGRCFHGRTMVLRAHRGVVSRESTLTRGSAIGVQRCYEG